MKKILLILFFIPIALLFTADLRESESSLKVRLEVDPIDTLKIGFETINLQLQVTESDLVFDQDYWMAEGESTYSIVTNSYSKRVTARLFESINDPYASLEVRLLADGDSDRFGVLRPVSGWIKLTDKPARVIEEASRVNCHNATIAYRLKGRAGVKPLSQDNRIILEFE